MRSNWISFIKFIVSLVTWAPRLGAALCRALAATRERGRLAEECLTFTTTAAVPLSLAELHRAARFLMVPVEDVADIPAGMVRRFLEVADGAEITVSYQPITHADGGLLNPRPVMVGERGPEVRFYPHPYNYLEPNTVYIGGSGYSRRNPYLMDWPYQTLPAPLIFEVESTAGVERELPIRFEPESITVVVALSDEGRRMVEKFLEPAPFFIFTPDEFRELLEDSVFNVFPDCPATTADFIIRRGLTQYGWLAGLELPRALPPSCGDNHWLTDSDRRALQLLGWV